MCNSKKAFEDLLKVLKVIGSPYVSKPDLIRINGQEVARLYALAKKNKIGLLFLESVNKIFPEINLDHELVHQRLLREEQWITIEKSVGLLKQTRNDFVVIKTLADFPYVASDVDILIMGDERSYSTAVNLLLKSGFVQIEHAKLQNCFHDSTRAVHVAIGKKDVYDVDLYQEMSASYLIYLDKRFFDSVIEWKMIDHIDLPILKTEADLLLVIVHSIFPEQLYTLYHYYMILFLLNRMSWSSLKNFMELVKNQHVLYPIRLALKITAFLHYESYGFIPSVIQNILALLNLRYEPTDSLFFMPYRYSIAEVFLTLWFKLRDGLFRESVKKQVRAVFIPSYLDYIIRVAVDRRVRGTY
ncbi:MAG: hypothetical protein ACFFDT_00375 [Candidatus Hodarchaeota archaeon]